MPTLPAGALAALVVLALLAISLDMFALRDLFRRPTSQVVFANKWIWVAIILLASSFSLGAIIYLVAGRRPAVLTDAAAPSEAISVRTESVADALYGPRARTDDECRDPDYRRTFGWPPTCRPPSIPKAQRRILHNCTSDPKLSSRTTLCPNPRSRRLELDD